MAGVAHKLVMEEKELEVMETEVTAEPSDAFSKQVADVQLWKVRSDLFLYACVCVLVVMVMCLFSMCGASRRLSGPSLASTAVFPWQFSC